MSEPATAADSASSPLLKHLDAFGLRSPLQQLKMPAAIVADEVVLKALKAGSGGQAARRIAVEDLMAGRLPTPVAGPYFVATATNELTVKHHVRTFLSARGLSCPIYGMLHDIVPMVLGEANGRKAVGLEVTSETLSGTPSLLIFCTPRSGSQFLARKLHERGIGAPREHVRPDVIALFQRSLGGRAGEMRFAPFFAGLVHHARDNGVFATKLISHFVADLKKELTASEWAFFEEYVQRSHILYLLRSNKLLQGLSRDRAKSTQHYHVFSQDKREDYRTKSQVWTYDFDRMLREVRLINREEAHLFNWLRSLLPRERRLPAIYETMDVGAIVETSLRAVGVPARAETLSLPTQILRDEMTEEFAARFRDDYGRTYRIDDPNTQVAHWVDYDSSVDMLVLQSEPNTLALPT